jgi:RNA polymerase sigma factor for flagellar operon FliA
MYEVDVAELRALWSRARAGDHAATEELVRRYHWLPQKIARSKRVPPHFDRDDMVSWANSGLFDAVRKFDPDSGDGALHEHFIGYATLRINGAILDGMKAPGQSWATREVWRRLRAMEATEAQVSQDLGRPATRQEVAAALGTTVADLPVFQQQVGLQVPTQGGEVLLSDWLPDHEGTEEAVEISEMVDRVAEKVSQLPAEHLDVVSRLFLRGEDVKDVAAEVGLTITRTRRLRAEALLRLRDLLQQG